MSGEASAKGASSSSLRADEPIRSSDDDQLARGRLIDVIGRHILTMDVPDSVVIALNAPWGAGKSSFLNLLEARLVPEETVETNSKKPPIVIRFNPWHYGSVEQLVRMFFAALAHGIGKAGREELGKKIGKLLHAAGAIASAFSSGAGSALKDAGKTLKAEKGLPELKAELDKLLPDLDQRIVVFIDDIDRLERDVLRLLFRMVRLNADFPNVTYVLAFDRSVVERNLDEENGIRGRDYLEKIIQVSFDIPEPEAETIHRILFAEMDTVLNSLETRPLDKHRWGNVFHSGFKEHFRTIRQIKRYSNGLRLTLAPIAQEVNLVDFLAIELIRVFHPEVYRGIVQGKDMLVTKRTESRDSVPTEQLRDWTEALCRKASPGFEDDIRKLLLELFPKLSGAYANTTYGHDYYGEWRKTCRVCSPEVFDKFFLLAIPSGEISEVEIAGFVAALGDIEATNKTLRRALESDKARRLLERLQDFTDELPTEHVAPLMTVMFTLGDDLRFKSRGTLDTGADRLVPRIISQSIRRLESESDRCNLLLKCIQEGAALYTAVQVTLLSEPQAKASEARLISDHSRWDALRDAAVTRINTAHEDGSLWMLKQLIYVLFCWMKWTTEEKIRDVVAAHVGEDNKLVTFIRRFVHESHSHAMGDQVARVRRNIEKRNLRELTDLEVVTERLKSIASGEGEQASAATDLVMLLEAKPEWPWDG
ncbi:MAG: KAP family P-loop domain protein [Haliangiales bacterium]